MKTREDYAHRFGNSYYTIGESLTVNKTRFYYIHGLGGGTMKENETLEEAVNARLIREGKV